MDRIVLRLIADATIYNDVLDKAAKKLTTVASQWANSVNQIANSSQVFKLLKSELAPYISYTSAGLDKLSRAAGSLIANNRLSRGALRFGRELVEDVSDGVRGAKQQLAGFGSSVAKSLSKLRPTSSGLGGRTAKGWVRDLVGDIRDGVREARAQVGDVISKILNTKLGKAVIADATAVIQAARSKIAPIFSKLNPAKLFGRGRAGAATPPGAGRRARAAKGSRWSRLRGGGLKALRQGFGSIGYGLSSSLGNLPSFGGIFSAITTGAAGATAAVTALGAATAAAGLKAIRLGANYEDALTTFSTMLGSESAGKSMISKLQKFATSTSYSIEGSVAAGRKLLSFGVGEEDVLPVLKALGTVAQGDTTKLKQLSLVYAKVKSQGRLQGDELNSLNEFGIDAASIAKAAGLKEEDLRPAIEKGKIGIRELNIALNNLTGAGGRFSGLLEKSSQNTWARWNSVIENIDLGFQRIGITINQLLKDSGAWDTADKLVKQFKDEAPAAIKSMLPDAKQLGDFFKEAAENAAALGRAIPKAVAGAKDLKNGAGEFVEGAGNLATAANESWLGRNSKYFGGHQLNMAESIFGWVGKQLGTGSDFDGPWGQQSITQSKAEGAVLDKRLKELQNNRKKSNLESDIVGFTPGLEKEVYNFVDQVKGAFKNIDISTPSGIFDQLTSGSNGFLKSIGAIRIETSNMSKDVQEFIKSTQKGYKAVSEDGGEYAKTLERMKGLMSANKTIGKDGKPLISDQELGFGIKNLAEQTQKSVKDALKGRQYKLPTASVAGTSEAVDRINEIKNSENGPLEDFVKNQQTQLKLEEENSKKLQTIADNTKKSEAYKNAPPVINTKRP